MVALLYAVSVVLELLLDDVCRDLTCRWLLGVCLVPSCFASYNVDLAGYAGLGCSCWLDEGFLPLLSLDNRSMRIGRKLIICLGFRHIFINRSVDIPSSDRLLVSQLGIDQDGISTTEVIAPSVWCACSHGRRIPASHCSVWCVGLSPRRCLIPRVILLVCRMYLPGKHTSLVVFYDIYYKNVN